MLFFTALLQTATLPLLSPMFGSHMVLQRDMPNTFWGWTSPGQEVTVNLAGRTTAVKADSAGKWTAKLRPPRVGGPYTMDVVSGANKAHLEDLLVGDVWICSGQSNMEMGITMVKNAQQEIAGATNSNIRLYLNPRNISVKPTLTPGGAWAVCSPQSVAADGWGGFSAAGYFFGRELENRLHIPIGLVETSWGGTVAESWTSETGLRPLKDFDAALNFMATVNSARPYAEQLDDWYKDNDSGTQAAYQNTVDDSAWKETAVPSIWERTGIGLNDFDGVVWYRHDFDLPEVPSGDVTFMTGQADDEETVWINGQMVGQTFNVSTVGEFRVPAGVLRQGKNTISIRLLDTGGAGGFYGAAEKFGLSSTDGKFWPLAGNWKYTVGANLKTSKPLPFVFGDNPNLPTLLYNGMISPIAPLAMKGAIWYQGESNSDRAKQYQRLLPAMIGDWRRVWGQGDFPFYIVQLANFEVRHPQPVDDAWADLREAQTMTAANVKNSGLAVAIDIGERNDIHPKDKQTVGQRLALVALHGAYHQNVPYAGPTFKSAVPQGSSIRVVFDHADQGLSFRGSRLAGFQLAGADAKFHWADARIEGNSVMVSSSEVAAPLYIRYAWDRDPEATLYNGAGLPAVPFRTR